METDLATSILRTQARLITGDFLSFAQALDTAGALPDGNAWLTFIEKPWKWARAYSVWVDTGFPMGDRDPDDVSGWRRFLDAIDGD